VKPAPQLAGTGGPASLLRGSAAWAAAAFLPFVVLAALHWVHRPPDFAWDEALYMLHARALAEGRPYTDTGYLYTRLTPAVNPAAQPPGLPLLLAPLVAHLGSDSAVIAAVMVAFALSLQFGVALYFRSHLGAALAVAAGVLTGLQPAIIHSASRALSDLPFSALVWGVIILADRPGRWSRRRLAVMTGLGVAAIMFRTAGIALVPALGLFAFVRSHELGRRPLVPIPVWITTSLVIGWTIPTAGAFFEMLSLAPLDILSRMLANFLAYKYAVFDALLYPLPGNTLNDGYHVIAVGIMALGLAAWLRQSARSFLAAFALAYVLFLLLAPVTGPRYLWPLAPLMVFGLLNGIVTLARRLWRVRPAVETVAGLTLAGGIAVLPVMSHAWEPREPEITEVTEVQAVFRHLRGVDAENGVRAMIFEPRALAWATRIPAMGLVGAPPDTVIAELCRKRITHVVVGDLGILPWLTDSVRATVAIHPLAFTETYRNPSFVIHRFVPAATQSGSPCPGPATESADTRSQR